MMLRAGSKAFLIVLWAVAGCTHGDIGQPCPELLGDADPAIPPEDNQAITAEVIEQNPTFPCEEMICIATAGRAGYCTKKCRSNAGCPNGFECREIQNIGEFANQKFCAWKTCGTRRDCGKKEEFCCVTVPGADPDSQTKFCDFANDGKCE